MPATVPYQTKAGGTADEQALFLLVTQSGRIWYYEPAYTSKSSDGKLLSFPPFNAHFSYVPADGLNGWDYSEAMKKWGAALGQFKKDQPPQ